MRQFARPMSLASLSLEARVLYSAFCVFLLIGLASSAWLWHDDGLGLLGGGAAQYYRGASAAPAASAAASSSDGPTLQLPADATDPAQLAVAKDPRQVMETFHFHLFSVPVCLLILGHLFMMTGLITRTKVAVLVVASSSTLAHLVAPLALRFTSAPSAVMGLSALVMGAAWAAMLLVPLLEMWRHRPDPA